MEILENIKIEPLDPTVTIPTELPRLHRIKYLSRNSRAPFGTDFNKFWADVKGMNFVVLPRKIQVAEMSSFETVAYRNSEGPSKSCQTQLDCENC